MRVLCACEESQACCKAFRARGHEAYSCDLEPCSGGHPEWHIQGDVLPLLERGGINNLDNGKTAWGIAFQTMDGEVHVVQEWDMLLAFPPCTHLAVSGARYFKQKQADGRQQAAIDFFLTFTRLDCPKVAIENPVGIMSTHYRKPDQIIQPYEYGHPYTKKTCLWLKGLPELLPTNILERPAEGWSNQQFTNGKYTGYGAKWGTRAEDGKWRRYGDPEVKKERSKTFPKIAEAMAEQWGAKKIAKPFENQQLTLYTYA